MRGARRIGGAGGSRSWLPPRSELRGPRLPPRHDGPPRGSRPATPRPAASTARRAATPSARPRGTSSGGGNRGCERSTGRPAGLAAVAVTGCRADGLSLRVVRARRRAGGGRAGGRAGGVGRAARLPAGQVRRAGDQAGSTGARLGRCGSMTRWGAAAASGERGRADSARRWPSRHAANAHVANLRDPPPSFACRARMPRSALPALPGTRRQGRQGSCVWINGRLRTSARRRVSDRCRAARRAGELADWAAVPCSVKDSRCPGTRAEVGERCGCEGGPAGREPGGQAGKRPAVRPGCRAMGASARGLLQQPATSGQHACEGPRTATAAGRLQPPPDPESPARIGLRADRGNRGQLPPAGGPVTSA